MLCALCQADAITAHVHVLCTAGQPTSVLFSYTGSQQSWTVPTGITLLSSVTVSGGGGGGGGNCGCSEWQTDLHMAS